MDKSKTISTLDDPSIKEFINLKNFCLEKENSICAQSEKVILKLLNSHINIKKILASEDFFKAYYHLIKKRDSKIELLLANKSLLSQIIGYNHHKGVFALAEKPPFTPIPNLGPNILIFNGLTSPENVGTLCRTAAAFNINSLIFDHKSASPYLKRSIRVSMGNVFKLKIHYSHNLEEDLRSIKAMGYQVIGTGNEVDSKPMTSQYFQGKNALIIGSEGHGMDLEIRALCNHTLKIKINEEVKHLNASAAGAIFLHEASKSFF